MNEKASPHLLIVEARFYDALADSLEEGAAAALKEAGATYNVVHVPGVLEIPAAISFAVSAAEDGAEHYDGFIALGCVIRGETSHYDIVANESARALMDLSTFEGLAIGNGILTVENEQQAWARAKMSDKNKGGGAAEAALAMISLRQSLFSAEPK